MRAPGAALVLQCGVSLVEVLVTLMVLSVGLLGLAALQTQSMRLNNDAYLRSQATELAGSLIDGMRLRGAAAADDYMAAAASGACRPAQANVVDEVRCWHAALAQRLPGGAGTVSRDATNPNRYTISVAWSDRDAAVAGAARSQAWTVDLQ